MPTISVALATRNGERYIGEAIASIVGQSRPADELLVLDDGSTDGTADIVRGFGDPVRLVQQAGAGVVPSFNRLFAMARSDFVALAADDDIWLPDKLERQAGTLAEHPQVDVAFGHAEFFGEAHGDHPTPRQHGLQDPELLRKSLWELTVICAPSAVIRRALHQRLGGFREDLPAEDYEFWLRALGAGATFYFDPRLTVRYRRHARNDSLNLGSHTEMRYQVHLEYAGDVEDPEFVRDCLAQDLRNLGGVALAEGRVGDARRAFVASLRRRFALRPAIAVGLLLLPGGKRLARRLASHVPTLAVER